MIAPLAIPRPRVGVRRLASRALVAAALLFVAGLAVMAAGSIAYGDWYLVRLPWADIGMWLIVLGLAGAGITAVAVVTVEPIGWWRLLAVPGTAVTGFTWVVIGMGLGASGACCEPPQTSIVTTLYSYPPAIAFLTLATASILLPFAGAAIRRGAAA